MQNASSVGIRTRRIHIFTRLARIHMLSRCLLTKFLHRSSGGSLLKSGLFWSYHNFCLFWLQYGFGKTQCSNNMCLPLQMFDWRETDFFLKSGLYIDLFFFFRAKKLQILRRLRYSTVLYKAFEIDSERFFFFAFHAFWGRGQFKTGKKCHAFFSFLGGRKQERLHGKEKIPYAIFFAIQYLQQNIFFFILNAKWIFFV